MTFENEEYVSNTTTTADPGVPIPIVDVDGIVTGGYPNEIQFVAGTNDVGATTLSASPPISPGTKAGQILRLIGTSTDHPVLVPSNMDGVLINSDCLLVTNSMLSLLWTGSNWLEISRNGI